MANVHIRKYDSHVVTSLYPTIVNSDGVWSDMSFEPYSFEPEIDTGT